MKKSGRNIGIVTCCADDWGGSEELWAKSIPYLQRFDHKITVYKSKFNSQHTEIRRLVENGVSVENLLPSLLFHKRMGRQLYYMYRRILDRCYHQGSHHHLVGNFRRKLESRKPDLVLISQGINFDGLMYAYECLKLEIPYIVVSHKAVEFFWPQIHDKPFMRQAFMQARLCCFVSHHNLRLTEDQFGFRFTNSKVVFNPVKIKRRALKYPSTDEGFRLACVGRLFLIDKGQDILIRILAQNKWRKRPVKVSLIGNGADSKNIQEMIDLYSIDNVVIENFHDDVEALWLNFHALILPSRSEGLPLTIIEAMAAGRTVIVSDAGGNAEMVEEGVTGFIGEATKRSFDKTMEHAWENRHRWETMGLNASCFVHNNIPELPEKDFANLIQTHLC